MDSQETQTYEKPVIVDYGTLVELTAAAHDGHHEDGLGKSHDEHSHPLS